MVVVCYPEIRKSREESILLKKNTILHIGDGKMLKGKIIKILTMQPTQLATQPLKSQSTPTQYLILPTI